MVVALSATQSIPQITEDHEPDPALFSTRTEYIGTPGATPTTPELLSRPPIVPATCVPCPLPSAKLFPVEQFTPPTTFRSPWGPLPVSMTATAGPLTVPLPFPDSWLLLSACIRLMPVGNVWATANTGRSSDTNLTRGSFRIWSRRACGMTAA